MIFLVSASFFEPYGASISDLIALLRGAAIRGHALWVVDDPGERRLQESKVTFESWCDSLSEALQVEMRILREALHRLSPQAVTRDAELIRVAPADPEEATGGSDVVLDLDQAIRLASLPLFLLVEDAVSDSAFLRRVMPPPWQKRLKEWEAKGMVCFEHGGGAGSMKRSVESYRSGRALPPWGLGPEAWRVAHFILSDRDTTPTGGMGDNIKALRKACKKHGMQDRLEILKRSGSEDYLPPQAVRAIQEKGLREKNAFFELADEISWNDTWFAADGSAEEMTELAERIAALV